MKGFALRLVLKQRHKRTWKWPIFARYVPLASQSPYPIKRVGALRGQQHIPSWPLRAPIIVILVTFGQMCNFRNANLVTLYLCMYLILNKEHFTFHLQYKHSGTFANCKYEELSHPKNQKMCNPILVTLLKIRSEEWSKCKLQTVWIWNPGKVPSFCTGLLKMCSSIGHFGWSSWVFRTFLDFTRMWTRWNFESTFLKIVHQKDFFEAIKENQNFPTCRRILHIYRLWLLSFFFILFRIISLSVFFVRLYAWEIMTGTLKKMSKHTNKVSTIVLECIVKSTGF